MRRWHFALVVFAAVTYLSTAVQAETTFWERCRLDYWRNKCWPEPFRQADIQAARDPFVIMKDNGWRIHNTLSDHFFDKERQSLTRAGEIKVRWIVTQGPIARRTVYVLRGESPEITQVRSASVQEYLSRIVLDNHQPEVLLTDIIPPDGSGEYFDAVDRQFKSSVPLPRLSAAGGGTSGGGGAGGSSGTN